MQLVHEQMNGIPGVSGASTITITIMSTIANSNRINIITNAIHFLFISLNHNEKTRPSILCVTPQMSRKKRNYSVGWTVPLRWWIISGNRWYWVSIRWYWLVLGQYKLVLIGIRWYRVSEGLVCLYILEKVEFGSGVTDAWQTDRQQNIELLSLPTV